MKINNLKIMIVIIILILVCGSCTINKNLEPVQVEISSSNQTIITAAPTFQHISTSRPVLETTHAPTQVYWEPGLTHLKKRCAARRNVFDN